MDAMKTVITRQCYSINQYKNLKSKIPKCTSNTYFNKQCVNRGLITNYYRKNFPNKKLNESFDQ